MGVAGLTTTGFEAKTLAEIKAELEDDERGLISSRLNTTSAGIIGQLNGIFATKLRQLWELQQSLYDASFTDNAVGYALTLRAALTGTTRRAATYSRVTATVNVDPGTYAAGTLIASVLDSPDARFANVEAVTNGGASAADVSAIFDAITTGPVRANAGTLTVIAQAVTGWNSVTNAADATLGEVEEGDAALRLRREAELRAIGSTNADAIRADLLRNVTGVLNVRILENDTGTTDGDGVPGHSLECIVYGPASPAAADDQAVADQIFASKAAGIGTYGSTTKTVVNAQGTSLSLSFTRPTTVTAYASLTISVDADLYAGDAAVQAAVAATADGLDPGEALDWRRVVGAPYSVAGVLHVTAFGLSTSGGGPFTETDVTPTVREVVALLAANVTVTVA